jgi:hypothetical protein
VILVQTMLEIVVDGKVVNSDGSTIECATRDEALLMISRMRLALLYAETQEKQPCGI